MNRNTTWAVLRLFTNTSYKRLKSSGQTPEKMKVFTQKKNPISGDTDWDIQDEDYDFHQEVARSAFADMLHDRERNEKYEKALKMAIDKMHADGKQANVLDIGTGTGLLSIMAARCGADTIVACDSFKPIANCCIEILKRNGVDDKITVIAKRSTDLTVGEDGDMKQKANILVTEVFDTELIGEGALATFTHAHKYLLEKDCIVVPDSAVMYAQVVESPTLQKCNKLNDLVDDNSDTLLQTPKMMRDCAGTAAVHDMQLSQLPRCTFRELTLPTPIFHYDWSGRTSLEFKQTTRHTVKILETGVAQAVFMWWELNMDTEGKVLLSCAPWWNHPDVNIEALRPQDSIPWRDHWMQAVYYFPRSLLVNRKSEVTLISVQDEYSLWFYLENQKTKFTRYKKPVCECGIHLIFSRTYISYLNDGKRSKKFLAKLKDDLDKTSVVLDLNGPSFKGLAAAKMGAKSVYVLESHTLDLSILKAYAITNAIENVTFVSKVTNNILSEVTHVICDPNFCNAVLPWHNLKLAYQLYKFKGKGLRDCVTVIPESCEFWAMPVEFLHLHKIKSPLKMCEGIDLKAFDDLIENSRDVSDDELEAQPLWEYPCLCRGRPQRLLQIDLNDLKPTYVADDSFMLYDPRPNQKVNGIAVWASWMVGGKALSFGPTEYPMSDEFVQWDPHSRQAVKILEDTYNIGEYDTWTYQVACDLVKGQFDLTVDLVLE